jgi:hypothetical protein
MLMLGAEPATRQFEAAVAPCWHEGRIVGFAGSAVDVTDRIKAQDQLQAQLAFTELLLE